MLSSASTTQAYFVLRFPILRWVSPLLFIGILQSIAAGIGTSNFLRFEFFVVWLNEEYSSQLSGVFEFGFSTVHLCFALFLTASDINFHIPGHTSSGREVVCFLVSLLPDLVCPSGGLSFSRTNLENPVHASDNSLSPSGVGKCNLSDFP